MNGRSTQLHLAVVLAFTSAYVVVLVPWIWRVHEAPIHRISMGLAFFTLTYWLGAGAAARRFGKRPLASDITLASLQAMACVTFMWMWQIMGGIEHSSLLVLLLPVTLASALLVPGWPGLLPTGATVTALFPFAVAGSAGLRWSLHHAGFPEWAVPALRLDPSLLYGQAESVSSRSLLNLICWMAAFPLLAHSARVLARSAAQRPADGDTHAGA